MKLRLASAVAFVVLLVGCSTIRATHLNGTRLNGRAAPDFTLTDQHNTPWQLAQQHGEAVVLFFGYTHCADTCPVTLGKLASARAALGKQSRAVEIAFITVDPTRDTPPVMARYLAQRWDHAQIVGLTGSNAQIAAVERAYHMWAAKLPGDGNGYAEAHNSQMYIIGNHGRERILDDANDTVAQLTSDLKTVVQ